MLQQCCQIAYNFKNQVPNKTDSSMLFSGHYCKTKHCLYDLQDMFQNYTVRMCDSIQHQN